MKMKKNTAATLNDDGDDNDTAACDEIDITSSSTATSISAINIMTRQV